MDCAGEFSWSVGYYSVPGVHNILDSRKAPPFTWRARDWIAAAERFPCRLLCLVCAVIVGAVNIIKKGAKIHTKLPISPTNNNCDLNSCWPRSLQLKWIWGARNFIKFDKLCRYSHPWSCAANLLSFCQVSIWISNFYRNALPLAIRLTHRQDCMVVMMTLMICLLDSADRQTDPGDALEFKLFSGRVDITMHKCTIDVSHPVWLPC